MSERALRRAMFSECPYSVSEQCRHLGAALSPFHNLSFCESG